MGKDLQKNFDFIQVRAKVERRYNMWEKWKCPGEATYFFNIPAEKAYLAAIRVNGKSLDEFSTENTTTTFNLARLYESLHRSTDAKRSFPHLFPSLPPAFPQLWRFRLYKGILSRHPNYIDCYKRLGIIAQNNKQVLQSFVSKYFLSKSSPVWRGGEMVSGNIRHFPQRQWRPNSIRYFDGLFIPVDLLIESHAHSFFSRQPLLNQWRLEEGTTLLWADDQCEQPGWILSVCFHI